MIRKGIFILNFLLSVFCFGQKYNFTYAYTYKPDSLHLEKTETELMGLFIDKNGSTYFRNIKLNLSAYIPVTESRYKKALEDYIKDPMSRMRELKQRYNITSLTSTMPDGTSYSDREYEKNENRENPGVF